jgi:hypothetical protein
MGHGDITITAKVYMHELESAGNDDRIREVIAARRVA